MKMKNNFAYAEDSPKINKRLTEHSKIFEKKVYKTASQVYTAVGYAIETPVMIEGDKGIIIIDPCESHNAMEEIMVEFRKVTDKPVNGVIYTHHHPDHWAGVKACTTEEEVKNGNCVIIAHKDFEYELAKMTGILADIKIGRAMYMYGYLLPEGEDGRVNLGLGPMMRKDEQHFILPTEFVDEKLKITICGIDFEIYHIPSECKDEICVWMPNEKILHVAECIQGENFPNLYSIRGSSRDPLVWIASIDFMRTLPAEYIVGNHMRPIEGSKECADHLRDYRDMIQYTHDQTIRLINKGLTPDNIIKELEKLPPHLFQRPRMGEHYGTFIQGVKLVFSMNVGWFNGDAATLDPLPPAELAKEYVRIIGRDNLLWEGQKAIYSKNYRLAAELLSNLVKSDPKDMEARALKATALRHLGYATENGPFRNWYMTQAMNLEGHFEEVKKVVPEFNGPGVYFDSLTNVPPQYLWDCLKVKLNGIKSNQVHTGLTIHLTDCDIINDLEIRYGIMEVHKSGDYPTIGKISLKRLDYLLIFTKLKTVEELFHEGKVDTTLPLEKIVEFFEYFDGFTPLFDMEFPFE